MKIKSIIILLLCASMLSLTACKSEEIVEEVIEEEVNTTSVMGQVVDIVGNEVTVQLVADSSSSSGMMSGMTGQFTEGEIPEGLEEGEIPEGMEEGSFSERTEGEIPEGLEEGEIPEGMEVGSFSGRTEGEIPEGLEEGELPDGMSEEELEGMMGSGMMSGMMGSSMEIELSDETVSYTIPVGATVYVNGVESSFSAISEESYITITMNESGTIIEVTVMG